MNKAVFLDRDGVILHNQATYIRSWDQVTVYSFSFKALARLAKSEYKIILLTNQSAVGRGLVDLQTVLEINNQVIALIKQNGGRIDDVFLCPHAPSDHCCCRKPLPGMIEQAAEKHHLNLEKSWLIGDALTDLQAGVSSGIKNLILVRTGRGNKQLMRYKDQFKDIQFQTQANLLQAIKLILIK